MNVCWGSSKYVNKLADKQDTITYEFFSNNSSLTDFNYHNITYDLLLLRKVSNSNSNNNNNKKKKDSNNKTKMRLLWFWKTRFLY